MYKIPTLLVLIVFQLNAFSNNLVKGTNQSIGNNRSNEYLIVFTSPGLIENYNPNGNLKSAFMINSLQADHDRLKLDLFTLRENTSQLKSASLPVFKHELYRTMNAVILIGSEDEMVEIRKLDYVKTVLKNQKIISYDNNTSGSHAPSSYQQIESTYPETGKGVKVGIIDTGIDYNNPALGGGYGPGFKVAGGYDFANMDDDPMDESGHGTAVAGIIAAKGDLVGVAPEATLYAYKIFNKETFAWSEDIVLALELATDPNRDLDLYDHLDVINMSVSINEMDKFWLDLFAERLQKLLKLNMIICISTGNDGPTYNKINMLCLLEDVIAVGSCNSNNLISSFSSRGYGAGINNCNMKPDLVALGEEVPVLWLSSSTRTENGTSLSTPYASGVAALLKQKHPQWMYNEYKSALLNCASDLGFNIIDQGAGKVNPEATLKLGTICYPQSINIGFVPNEQGVEEKTFSITIYNKSSASQEYHFDFSKSMPKGVDVHTEPSNFIISSNDSAIVNFTMKLDPEKLEHPQSDPFNFYGRFHLVGTSDSLEIPWSFQRGFYVEFTTDIDVDDFFQPFVKIIKDTTVINPYDKYQNGMKCLVQQGVYDIIFNGQEKDWIYGNDTLKTYLYVKENVSISENTRISLNKSEIKNKIAFQSYDANGELIEKDASKKMYNFIALKSNHFGKEPISRQGNADRIYVNDLKLSDKYEVFCGRSVSQNNGKEVIVINHEGIHKITRDTLLINTPKDLHPFHFSFYPNPNEECNFGFGSYFYYGIFGDGGFDEFPLKTPTNSTLWIDVKKDKSMGLSAFPFVSPANFSGAMYPKRQFSRVYSYGDSIQFNTIIGRDIVLSVGRKLLQSIQQNDTVFVNNGPVYYCLSVTSDKYNFNGCFTDLKGMYGESSQVGYAFTTLSVKNSNNQAIYNGLMKDAPAYFYDKDMQGASVELSTQDYFVMGVKGKANLKYNFNKQGASNSFTSMHCLQFLDDKNQVRPKLNIGTAATLNLVLNNAETTKSISLYFKYSDETEWKQHPFEVAKTTFNEDFLHADVSDLLTRSIGLDLKVVKEDFYGNTMNFTLEPAIAIGGYHQSFDNTNSTTNSMEIMMNQMVLYPNPTTGIVQIQQAPIGSIIELYNLRGEKLSVLYPRTDSSVFSIDLSEFNSGIYILKVRNKGATNTFKICKL